MPILDLNTAALPALDFDVVIAGAGAAGIFLAVKLGRTGRRVLLLESGHGKPDPERQVLNEIEQTAKRLSNANWTRKRILGGTTTAWGGQALPFESIDFEARAWVPNSGWPITRQTLDRYYAEAAAFMRLDAFSTVDDLFQCLRTGNPGFSPAQIQYHYSKWAPEPNFWKLYGRSLPPSITVAHNAHLARIDLSEAGKVASVVVANFRGNQVTFPCRRLVVATGGIESTRILLLNDHQRGGGLGNHNGWLGRAFMEHPSIHVGVIQHPDAKVPQRVFATRLHRGRKYSVRLSASAEWQRRHRSLNISAGFLFTYPNAQADPYAELRRLVREHQLPDLSALVGKTGAIWRGATTLFREGYMFKPAARTELSFLVEQEPLPESQITLSSARDPFGARLARLNWRLSPLSWLTTVKFARAIKAEIEQLGLGEVTFAIPLDEDLPDWEHRFTDVNHHMGGTRMSAEPGDGVVTPDLNVWGIPNLFVCSASTFPTSSHSNPTFTLLALTARLGDHLLQQCAAAGDDGRGLQDYPRASASKSGRLTRFS